TLGRPGEAASHYAALAAQSPTAARYTNLGSALAAAGRMREAVEAFEQALRLDPSLAAAHENLALTYLHLGDRQAAAMHHAEAARLTGTPPTR
ncbi:MAG TPA: tetratricopeptide repeat protein, partial [Candidatus Polarisedimenticolaceae bacterium]|nr:tetratricopeptide repeat protein [Candidatus Polarisedimenticolaceae bacterium]